MLQVQNKKGLEIGGPSPLFMFDGQIPLYGQATELDCVCFNKSTVWNTAEFIYAPEGKRLGIFIEAEATNLLPVKTQMYEYLLSCHQLEHCANPIKALYEFFRVMKVGGKLLLVLPNKLFTFDHQRPFTELKHLLDDYHNQIDESDLTHFDEIIRLHDLKMDPGAPQDIQGFMVRSLNNATNRCFHHHVFDTDTVIAMLAYVGFIPIHNENLNMHMIFTAVKD